MKSKECRVYLVPAIVFGFGLIALMTASQAVSETSSTPEIPIASGVTTTPTTSELRLVQVRPTVTRPTPTRPDITRPVITRPDINRPVITRP